MIYEILDNSGHVVNTIIADNSFVEQNYPGSYRLVGPVPEPMLPKVITKAALLTRFTDPEFTQIISASKTDVDIELWYVKFNAASTFDLDNQRTKDGIAMLVTKNLLQQARADAILTDPVQPGERP